MTAATTNAGASNPGASLDTIAMPGRTTREKAFDVILWGTFFVLLVWSFGPAEMNRFWQVLWGSDNMAMLLKDFLEPNFRYRRSYLDLMLESVQMAVWGSVLSVLLAIPFGLLSSVNMVPGWVVFPVRRLMDACRAIKEEPTSVARYTARGNLVAVVSNELHSSPS